MTKNGQLIEMILHLPDTFKETAFSFFIVNIAGNYISLLLARGIGS